MTKDPFLACNLESSLLQNRKLVVGILALLTVPIFANFMVPSGHADDISETITSTGYVLRHTYDSFYGQSVDAVQAGSTLTFTVVFIADNQNYQRNITMGVKFDWMTSFQNTTSSTPVIRGQAAYITLPFTMPALSGQYASLNLTPHTWTVQVWDMAIGAVWTNGCFDSGITSCRQFSNNFSYPVAVYSSTQASCMLTAQQAATEISALGDILSTTKEAPPGTNAAVASLVTAEQQLSLGQTAYQTGNFIQAQTNFQNALNSANAAQNSLATTGGGTDTASLTSIWLVAVAGLLGGIGALLFGLGGFNYLRKRAVVPK